MNEKIEPALSAEEWASEHSQPRAVVTIFIERDGSSAQDNRRAKHTPDDVSQVVLNVHGETTVYREELPALIALANHALPESDPRKITRETIAAIRGASVVFEASPKSPYLGRMTNTALAQIADALESYLPPEDDITIRFD